MKQLPTDTIGQRIKVVRKRANMTQKQLTEKLGKTNDYVSKLERDEFTPSMAVLIQIAKETNCSLDFVVLGKDTEAFERAFQMFSTLSLDIQNEMIDVFSKITEMLCKTKNRE